MNQFFSSRYSFFTWARIFSCAITMMSFAPKVMAEETTTTSTPEVSVQQSKTTLGSAVMNKKFQENTEITDAKIKADAGSLSKYSLKFNLSYYGPTLGDLSAKDQPNPDKSIGPYETSLGGAVGFRYRFDSKTTLSMGTGLKVIHPLHGAERFDVQTPYMSYDSTFRWGDFQIRSSPGFSLTTIPNYVDVGQVGTISYDLASIYLIPSSDFALTLDGNLSLFLYNRDYRNSDRQASREAVQAFPGIKYNFTDRTSMMTSTALTWLSPRYRGNETTLLNRTLTQRLGVGHAFSREVYIFPYLTILPTKMAMDSTTFNLSTSFSLL